MERKLRWVAAAVTVLVTWAATAERSKAHGFNPSFLEVREETDGRTEVIWKTPRVTLLGMEVRPVLPEVCEMLEPPSERHEEATKISRWVMHCSTGLTGQTVEVVGLGESKTDVLVRIQLADGRLIRAVLSNRQPAFEVPEREPRRRVVSSFFRLGIEHILAGFDHLLFLFGLLLLVRRRRLLVQTITGFTLGHSLTLSCVVLGVASVPTRWAEAAIALSLLILAVELARPEDARPGLMRRHPPVIASLFGLLHGFGFASALTALGLPESDVPLALFSFNVGIEAGQLLFVTLILTLLWLARPAVERMPAWSSAIPVYLMGALAAFWSIERLLAAF